MKKESLINRWILWNESHNLLLGHLILIFVSAAFVLSDWVYGLLAFSDYLLILVFGILTITGQFRLKSMQLKGILAFLTFCLIHLLVQLGFNENFDLKIEVISVIKLSFYIVITLGLFNYIKRNMYENLFKNWNNIFAILVIIIGIYITFELYRETRIPHEVFWKFTRTDIYSYYFESNPSIIRTRSVFSEPAHLGFYLNTILAVNLFSLKKMNEENIIIPLLLSFGVFLTFSYSMIAILVIITTFKFVTLFINGSLVWKNWMWVLPLISIGVIVAFWDVISVTLVQRSIDVLTGEDISARMRLLDSWQYVSNDSFIIGNGFGHTPAITNIYAYMLSDIGIFALLLSFFVSGYLMYKHFPLGVTFVFFNLAKGGYLSSGYWIMVLTLIIFIFETKQKSKHINTIVRL